MRFGFSIRLAFTRFLLKQQRRKTVATATKQPTPEQAAALEKEKSIQAKASYDFMVRHREDYVANIYNNNLLAEFLRVKEQPWRLDNLEAAFEILAAEDEFDNSIPPSEAPKPVTPVVEQGDPWPTPLTRMAVATMDRGDFKKYMRDERFKEQLRALGIKA
jgi:hypothetical protein